MESVYLNNGATSYPKPRCVLEAVAAALAAPPAEAGRAIASGDPLLGCRTELAALFGVDDPATIALLPSATHALNQVITGILRAGDRVVTTVLEHNSVLRPLAHLASERAITTTHLEPGSDGRVTAEKVAEALAESTALLVLTAASNVTGCVQPLAEIAAVAAAARVPLLIDAAQSAGAIPLDHGQLPGRVFVAFAGHKGLLGPTGVGGLIVPDGKLAQTMVGGTGVRSESLLHPGELPLRHEAGTPNLPGIAGLAAGVRWLLSNGVAAAGRHRHDLVCALRSRLGQQPGIRLLPLAAGDGRAGIVSFTYAGWPPEELGYVLHQSFAITTRSGLHCAPLIHKSLGTAPLGTTRVSVGPFTSPDEIDRFIWALAKIGGR